MDVIDNKPINSVNPHHTNLTNFKTNRGITLIQLMMVISIISISLGIGIPSVSAMIEINRMASTVNTLSRNFALARSEAVTRAKEVIICKSKDGEYCTTKGGWEQGWLVYVDDDGDEKRGNDEDILWVQNSFPPAMEISFAAFRSRHYVHYWPSGSTKMNGTFVFCHKSRNTPPKGLILNKVGRIRKTLTRWDGSPLACG